jgi:hypothetical protein
MGAQAQELARVFADPYSAADFEHGPWPARARRPVLANGPARADARRPARLLARLRDDLDALAAVVSDDAAALAVARWPLRVPTGHGGSDRSCRSSWASSMRCT